MAEGNLSRSLAEIFGHEGGYTASRSDPGNWTGGAIGKGSLKGTKYGISAQSYPKLDIKNLTLKEAETIYRRDYANRVKFDSLPAGVDHAVLDFAINSGPHRSVQFLQRIVGVNDDGRIGPATLSAVRSVDADVIINQLCDDRLSFLQGLRIWETYKRGWTRRVAEVREFALKLASEKPHTPTEVPSPAPKPTPKPKMPTTAAGAIGALIMAVVAAVAKWVGWL